MIYPAIRRVASALTFLVLCTPALHAQLSGTYTVGTNGDFETLSEAVDNLNGKGVDGPTTFRLLNGGYFEQVRIAHVPGAGAENPIVIESESGDPESVVLSYDHPGSSANNNEHVLRIDSTEHLTLRNLTLSNQGSVYGTGVRLFGASDVTLEDLIINLQPDTKFVQQLNAAVHLVNAPRTTIRRCRLSGGYAGVFALGFNQSPDGLIVEGNTIRNIGTATHAVGIVAENNADILLARNDIEIRDGNGIYLKDIENRFRIEANTILVRPIGFGGGIQLTDCAAGTERSRIANNAVLVVDGDTLTACIGIAVSGVTNADFVFNSVHLSNFNTTRFQSTSNAVISFSGFDNDSLRIFNNIFSNTRGREVILYPVGNTVYESDYNDIYTTGDILGRIPSGTAPNLDSIRRSTGQEEHSFSTSPCYESRSSLRTHSSLLDNAGRPFAGVTIDIEGNQRNPLAPDIGAFEYTFSPHGMRGAYTIGEKGDYRTLREALEDLHVRCVEAPVELLLDNGVYEERNTLKEIPGTDEQNTITIRSGSEDRSNVILTHDFQYPGDHILRLQDAGDLVIRDLTFRANDTIFNGVTLHVAGHSHDISVEQNAFENGPEGKSDRNTTHIYSGEDDRPDNILIRDNRFSGGYSGINFSNCFGFDCEESDRVSGTTVTGNTFLLNDTGAPSRLAVSLQHHRSPVISRNDIQSIGTGISLAQCDGFLRIRNNRIDVAGSSFAGSSVATGINIVFPGTMEPFGLISNNMIRVHDPVYDSGGTTTLVGMTLGQSKNLFALYNTVVVGDSAGTSVALTVPFGTDSVVMFNNILANYGGGPALRIKFVERFYREFGIDNNLLYSTGDTIAVWNDTGRTSLAEIRAILGTDSNSIVGEPQFLSERDLHIGAASPAVRAGRSTNSLFIGDTDYGYLIRHDIDAEERSTERPEIGADELDLIGVVFPPLYMEPAGLELRLTGEHPVRSTGTIDFRLPEPGVVRIAIVNVRGEILQVLLDEVRGTAQQTLVFPTDGIPAGPYWVVATSGTEMAVEPIIIEGDHP